MLNQPVRAQQDGTPTTSSFETEFKEKLIDRYAQKRLGQTYSNITTDAVEFLLPCASREEATEDYCAHHV